ncbi:hypothetical protein CPC16_005867 [Podila verticillata]|nr:hypothetical protein CPC16_005867 [Podila verticillata]
MEAEILNYKEQVAALDSALQADPANEELLTIKTELLELITLTETLLQQEQQAAAASTAAVAPSTTSSTSSVAPLTSTSSSTSQPSSPPTSQGRDPSTQRTPKSASDASNQPIYQPPVPTKNWVVGDRCRALYAADGKFYEATILGVATGAEGPIYSVQYKGYEATAPSTLTAQDLKVVPDIKKYQKGHHQPSSASTAETGSIAETTASDGDKRKRGVQKQMAWQNFAKGGTKKAKGSGGILKKSIFATPDNPEGKVGVVGSGKGMTQFQQRGKHVYGSSPSSL